MWFIIDIAAMMFMMIKDSISWVISRFTKHYRNIDELPIYNYFKLLETGDTRYMMHEYKKYPVKFDKDWKNCLDEIGNKYESNHRYLKLLYKERELVLLNIKYIKTQDRKLLTHIRILEKEIDKLNEGNQEQNYLEQITIIEEYYKIKFNEKLDSIAKFLTYKNRYLKDGKTVQKSV